MESLLRSEDMPIRERFLLLVGRAMARGRSRAFVGDRSLKDSFLIDWEHLDSCDLREYFDEEGSRSRRFYYRGHPCMIGNSMLGCVIGLGRLMALDKGDDGKGSSKRKRSEQREEDAGEGDRIIASPYFSPAPGIDRTTERPIKIPRRIRK